MQAEKNYARDYSDAIKSKQAVNGDYSNTGYDRGQLNPSSFQCGDGRIATFTLTNSAPMDASFYTVHLKQWEECVKGILRNQSESEGTAYLVTGTVPSQDRRIPRQEEFDDVSKRDFHRVTVPTHIWTAVCYKHNVDDEKSFSFGYIGLNHPNSTINVMTVPQLNAELPALYGTSIVNIFTDDCFSNNRKSEGIIRLLYQSIQLPISETDASKKSEVTELLTEEGIHCMGSCLYRDNSRDYYCCDQKNREIPCSPDYSNVTVYGDKCWSDHTCGTHGYYYYWCYTHTSWDYCSPPPLPLGKGVGKYRGDGSMCRSDYNCGWYGNKYTWCYTDYSNTWDYCCNIDAYPFSALNGMTCKTDHPCDYYGYNYLWCYTTDGKWDYCCSL
ncbi:uncharacterized protein si:ch211-165i18.2 [Alosa alosa]|uniref:uncharacterized protein si:ch211-165i18.2 n=1 Tax=Alosa alosa TaxID=278164 RepID=UPI0020151612|nr:uncharacterized protein si:ch211-165i18.2 [Alosa alosa]